MTSLPVQLPDGFTPLVSVGDTVSRNQPIAVKKGSDNTASINIATELSLPVSKAGKAIKKNPGEKIKPGDIIASRAGFLGMGEQKVVSSVNGTVIAYERRSGELTIQLDGEESGEEEIYPSPTEGKVIECDKGKILIESAKTSPKEKETKEIETPPDMREDAPPQEKSAVDETGDTADGEIYFITHDREGPIPFHLLTPDIIGKVIVGREFDRDGLLKAIGMEVLAVVTVIIHDGDKEYILSKNLSVPLIQIGEKEFIQLSKMHGKNARLDGLKKNVVLLHV